jgi:hypothetical protein
MWEPFGSARPNGNSERRKGPDGRGTFNNLTACLVTLILCVWTALHLNIPERGKASTAQLAKRKSVWLVVGLFAPEYVRDPCEPEDIKNYVC